MEGCTRILVFGTFDVLHEGHRNFFAQARALTERPYLVVSIARDVNVARIKGQSPHFTEEERASAVARESLVDDVVLGAVDDYVGAIAEIHPDIIALGYDQFSYTEGLAERLATHGLSPKIVRLQPFQPERYKSSIIKAQRGLEKFQE